MKRVAILVVIALVLGIFLAAYAHPVKFELERGTPPADGGENSPHINGNETGFVIFNHTDEGTIVLQFQLRGLTTDFDYYVYYAFWVDGDQMRPSPYPTFGPIKVNKFGFGNYHYELPESESFGDLYVVGISDAVSCISKGNIIMNVFVVVGE